MNDDFTILLADDDEDDVWVVKRALNWADIHNPVQVVRDGGEAIAYLRGADEFADREKYPLPNIALLDIKMPKKTGLEVLEWIRNSDDEGLKRLPVIILSSSELQKDIDHAYQLGVNAYLIKPQAFTSLVETLRATTGFWKDVAAHPSIT
jgi:CheY-like chemotaxis protein